MKFDRSDVINVLPEGDEVPVTVTGIVGTTPFEGMDSIRRHPGAIMDTSPSAQTLQKQPLPEKE